MYYQNAEAAIIVYDLGDIDTFKDATRWIQELGNFLSEKIPIALAGNKADLPERVVPIEDAEKFAMENNAKLFYTSAKTGENVTEIFGYLAEEIYKTKSDNKPKGLLLKKKKNKEEKKCC